jgi:hypothetical protein
MAVITNYTTLQTAVGDWLARDDLSTFIPGFVQNWEEDFYREPDNWASWMESALSVSISNDVAAVPTDYLGLKIAYIDGQTSAPLKRISLDQLYQRYPRSQNAGDTAVYIARNGSNFEFGPIPSGGTLVGTYYAKPTLLRSDSDGSNFLITDCPDICLYGSLLAAAPFLQNDKRIPTWQAMYDRAVNSYRRRFKEEDYSGAPPHTVAA